MTGPRPAGEDEGRTNDRTANRPQDVDGTAGPDETVDGLADDVARLLRAVRDVAADHERIGEAVRGVVAAAADEPAGAVAAAPGAGHPSGSCRACPVCTGLDVLREVHPEVHEHLARAVSAVGDALRALLAGPRGQDRTVYPPGPGAESVPPRPEPVTASRIDIDEGAQ